MRHGIAAVAVGLLGGISLAAEVPVPKQGSIASLNIMSGTIKALPLGKERAQLAYEVMGVAISDTGEGLLHNASVRCMGGLHVVNGAFEDESGSCIYTRPDGDQAFTVYRVAGKQGVAAKGTSTFVGGTGKLTGISGTIEFTRTNARPAAEGTSQSVVRSNGSYKIP